MQTQSSIRYHQLNSTNKMCDKKNDKSSTAATATTVTCLAQNKNEEDANNYDLISVCHCQTKKCNNQQRNHKSTTTIIKCATRLKPIFSPL